MKRINRDILYSDVFLVLSILYFVGLIFLPIPYKSVIVILLILTSLTKGIKLKETFLLIKHPLVLLFLLNIIGLSYTEEHKFGFFILEKSLSFLFVPILFINYSANIKKFFQGYIIAIQSSIFILLAIAVFNSFNLISNEIIFNPYIHIVTENNNFFVNRFLYSNFTIFIHPSYLALYFNLALGLLLFNKKLFPNKKKYILLVLNLFSIVLISSKAGILVSVFLIVIYIIQTIKSKQKLAFLLTIVVLIVSGVLIFNPRAREAKNKFYRNGSFNLKNDYRIASWLSAVEIIKEHPIVGVGTGDSQKELVKVYKENPLIYAHQYNYNSHNQFIDYFIKFGLLGIISIIYLFLFLGRKNSYPINIIYLFILSIHMFFENIFNLSNGILFITFTYCIILKLSDETNHTKPQIRGNNIRGCSYASSKIR